ncbi:PREDICTED: la-related protein 6A-like isoform X2 [Camelina sativa]|uniref:La-related protein 6A-like isoform X2 n=1 Tax=Camelina sativa TaxID=90675 RepID=A0ABM0X6I2_CAMSA|nr:PREDICTED: la-related protein 6A-like isoform X2 [Camelina sativa]
MSSLPLRSAGNMETPSIPAAVPLQAPEDATAVVSQSQSSSHEVDSLPVTGSSDDVVPSEIPCLSPSDDDFDHERNSAEDRDQDHGEGDNLVETDVAVVVSIDELKKKIIRQVEYYFSDENLPTDKFLLNAMKRNKKGFVPIASIATFHKMKKLTRDHAVIVSALKESSFLVVSSDGKKVKRLSPLPEIRDPKIFTVLVENLPENHSDENIREIFGKAGSIKSVSICDPNAAEEPEKGCKKEKFIRTRLHAFVEYETVEAAEIAAATLNNEQDWRNGLRVKLLEQAFAQRRPARREVDKDKDTTGRVHDQIGEEKNKKTREHQPHRHHHSDNPADDDGGNHQKEKNGNKGRGGGQGRRQNHQGGNGFGHGTAPSTSSSSHHNHHPIEVSKRPPGPRMPDGTRGFTMGRGKAIPPPPTSAQTNHEV